MAVTLVCEGILKVQLGSIKIPVILICMVLVCCLFSVEIVEYIRKLQMDHMQMNQQYQLTLEQMQRTETALLQTQIKPHFLYNTLTAIEQMCELDSKKAQIAIGEFADYLRANVDFSVETRLIPIEKELENVGHYLALEQIRFGDRLTVTYDIKVLGFLIPPLVIQPMVENAVRHGVTKKREGGTVVIEVGETETVYTIIIKDDGAGFETKKDSQEERVHIGIDNVRSRVEGQCGGSVLINSHVGAGTTVTIEIPKERCE